MDLLCTNKYGKLDECSEYCKMFSHDFKHRIMTSKLLCKYEKFVLISNGISSIGCICNSVPLVSSFLEKNVVLRK